MESQKGRAKQTRKWIIVLLLLGACCAVLYIFILASELTEQTRQNTREIRKAFAEISSCIQEFRNKNGRLPSAEEYRECDKDLLGIKRDHQTFEYLSGKIPNEAIERCGSPIDGSFALRYWRGDDYDYFATWGPCRSLWPE